MRPAPPFFAGAEAGAGVGCATGADTAAGADAAAEGAAGVAAGALDAGATPGVDGHAPATGRVPEAPAGVWLADCAAAYAALPDSRARFRRCRSDRTSAAC
jgi:hypothetical protein